jgi:hypothetical protein
MSALAKITVLISDGGKLPANQSDYLRRVLENEAGHEVTITISEPIRTLDQNAFLWGYVYPPIQRALNKAGITTSTEALHAAMKSRYLPNSVETVFGQEVVVEPRSSKLTRKAFADFVDSILSDQDVIEAMAMAGEFAPTVDQYERRSKIKVK